jgi:hypothetical protein
LNACFLLSTTDSVMLLVYARRREVRISFDIPSSRKLKIEPCALGLDICSNPYLICKLTPHGETIPEFPPARGAGARCEDNPRITASLSLPCGYTVSCLFFSLNRVARGIGSSGGVYHSSAFGFTVAGLPTVDKGRTAPPGVSLYADPLIVFDPLTALSTHGLVPVVVSVCNPQ